MDRRRARTPGRLRLALVGLAVAAAVLQGAVPLAAPARAGGHGDGGPFVYLVAIDDVVGQGTVLDVQRAVDVAERDGVPLVVRLSTPGGLVSATNVILERLLNADVPVITYVGPRGASAFSAGTYILLSGHRATMNEGTQMGSAMPVVSGPSGTQAASNKTINALAAQMRSIAESRGRPADLAEEMVRENTDYTSSEALDVRLINATGADLGEVLTAVHGEQVEAGDRTWTLDTDGAAVVEISPGPLSVLYGVVGNPQVTFLLILVGMYGLIFGFAAPGTYVPETIGAVLLVLGLIGLGLFRFEVAALLLIALAVVFFLAEALTPTHGVLTVAGVISLAIGALMLPSQEPLLPAAWFEGFAFVVVGMAVFTGAFMLFIVTATLRSVLRTEVHKSVEHRRGVAVTRLDPRGTVRVRGEIWKAEAVHPGWVPPRRDRTALEGLEEGAQGILGRLKDNLGLLPWASRRRGGAEGEGAEGAEEAEGDGAVDAAAEGADAAAEEGGPAPPPDEPIPRGAEVEVVAREGLTLKVRKALPGAGAEEE